MPNNSVPSEPRDSPFPLALSLSCDLTGPELASLQGRGMALRGSRGSTPRSLSCDLTGGPELTLLAGLTASYALQLSHILVTLLLLTPAAADTGRPDGDAAAAARGTESMTRGLDPDLQDDPWTLESAARRMIACMDACGRLTVIHSILARERLGQAVHVARERGQ